MKAKAKHDEDTHDEPKGTSVTFIGDQRSFANSKNSASNPSEIMIDGKTFPLNKPVSVEQAWLDKNRRLRTNSHFAVVEAERV